MSFLDVETSVSDGNIRELYEFTSPSRVYRYTSSNVAFNLNGDIYEPQPIRRNAFAGSSQDDSPVVEVEIGVEAEICADFAFGLAENNLSLRIRRTHGTVATTATVWEGQVTSISVTGRLATFQVPSRFGYQIVTPVPKVYYQSQCNHVLYDARCTVARAAFTVETAVDTAIGVDVDVLSVGGQADQFYKGGVLERVSDGERRLVVSQITTNLVLNFPFRTLNNGDTVRLVAGCDRTVETCRDKFSNIINFGGHPLIPIVNVFEEGLD